MYTTAIQSQHQEQKKSLAQLRQSSGNELAIKADLERRVKVMLNMYCVM